MKVLQPASPLQGQVVAEEEGHDHRDGAFRLRAPPDLSREQLRSPLATPAKSPMTTTIPSAAIQMQRMILMTKKMKSRCLAGDPAVKVWQLRLLQKLQRRLRL